MAELKAQGYQNAAYHEAGHAVAAVVLGHPFREVVLEPTHALITHRNFAPFLDPARGDLKTQGLVIGAVLMAGGMAEREKLGEAAPRDVHTADFELAVAEGQCSGIPAEEIHPYLFAVQQRAREILAEHWPAVVRVAETLLDTGKLSRESIAALVWETDQQQAA